MKTAAAFIAGIILSLGTVLVSAEQQASDLVAPKHAMTLQVDPVSHRLSAKDRIELPPSTTTAEFVLADTLEIVSSNPPVERVPPGDLDAFLGIGSGESGGRVGLVRYRVGPLGDDHSVTLEWSGIVNTPLSDEKEQYSRGFRSTPGLIAPEGIYLSATSAWYPLFGPGLVSFELDVPDVPDGWHLITIGAGTSRDEDGHARWKSEGLVDDIYLVGGPLHLWKDSAGGAEALVYLHEQDDALATKYLTATAQYIEMYRSLIGPYPYAKFALVENFWETGYGMPSFTLLGPQVIRFPFIIVSSYPHEILHNWWGNSVFVDYETGNWCEGLTAYMADHLLKEQRGQGVEYRQSTLQKYRDYVSEGRDFPLSEFRSRHSAATEAVGYGKSLMGFHMLRRRVGDDAFRKALASFYRHNRGKRASFADLRGAFEEVTKSELGSFFHDWVERTGAISLVVSVEGVQPSTDGWLVRGSLRQTQPDEMGTFAMEVPVVLTAEDGIESFDVMLTERDTKFELASKSRPLLLEVDPWFDVFRLLDPRETPPSIGQIFGEAEIIAVVPSKASDEEQARWRELMTGWQTDSHSISIVDDSSLDVLPADRSIWLLGRENLLAPVAMPSDPDLGLGITVETVSLGGEEAAWRSHSVVVVRRNPGSAEHAVGWLSIDPADAFAGFGRKLPHYGKYSYLAFEGTEPVNTIKGQWANVDSPLRLDLRPAGERSTSIAARQAPDRAALAELPPVFSERKLLDHVTWLAAPDREGRGAGSKGLTASAEWIADRFKAAGLEPGGDDGSWFQNVSLPRGPDGKQVELVNVIGVLPGTSPQWKGQWNLVSAHYDHLGFGWPDGEKGRLHPGADDNASGVAVLVELAANLATTERPKRTLVFAAFTAEENGLVGSRHFVSNPRPLALDGLRAAVNLDTVGRLFDQKLTVLGAGTADEWPHIFRGIGWVTGIECRTVSGSTEGSDQQSFIEKGIPAIQIFTQAHLDYHKPGDVVAKIDSAGLVKVATVAREALVYLGERVEPLTVKIAGQAGAAAAAAPAGGRRVRFGTVPDFGFEGEGVRLDGVVPDSPAAKAGLDKGDVIVRMNGQEVKSLRGYSEILGTLEPGQKVEVVFAREGHETTVVVELEAR